MSNKISSALHDGNVERILTAYQNMIDDDRDAIVRIAEKFSIDRPRDEVDPYFFGEANSAAAISN